MVIRSSHLSSRRGLLMTELLVAMGMLIIAVLPITLVAAWDARLFRATYQRAVAMEIVDGEMEILAAGEWRDFSPGTHPYTVHANAAVNLPPGQFQLILAGNHLRLQWSSTQKRGIGPVVREATVQ